MSKISSIITVLVLIFSPLVGHASNGDGRVILILPHTGDQIFFDMENHNISGTCLVQGTPGKFRLDLNTKTGQAMYTLLLTAKAQEKTFENVVGSGICTGSRENVQYMVFR